LDTADALRRKDEALLKKYDELAQAIFIDMFGDPVKNEKGWEVKKFSEVSNKITDGEHTTPIRQSEGIHLLSARNIQNGYISLKNGVDYISESEYNRISKRCNPEFGDILLSCSGSVGRCTVYRSSDKIGLVRSVALIKPKHEQINSTFFEFSIRSEFLQNQILQNSSKSSQANLFTGKIKELNILVPHIELQKKFESIIELLTKQVSIKKNKNSENLFNSLLQKAFNGELIV
jgi:type I restriction enzyme S subunit